MTNHPKDPSALFMFPLKGNDLREKEPAFFLGLRKRKLVKKTLKSCDIFDN